MKIKALEILSNDLDNTVIFYRDMLGLNVASVDDTTVTFAVGNSTLAFRKSASLKPVYHFAFNIPRNQFEAALDWAGRRFQLISIDQCSYVADFKSWNAKAFYFFDNNQNIVEMIARFDLPNESDSVFEGNTVCSISEIGAVVDDPLLFAEYLQQAFGVSYFSKQEPANDFKAVGDDEGLLIIVPPNRTWYPTAMASTKQPTGVVIEVNGRAQKLVFNNAEQGW